MKNIKIFIYAFFIISIMLMSCNGNKNKTVNTLVNTDKISNKESDEQKVRSELLEIINPILFEELDNFTRNMEVSYELSDDINIVSVFFGQEKDGCCAFILTSHVYDSGELSGYIILNEKMVAFYNLEDECNCNLVDATKLKTDKTDKYPDEYSRLNMKYDPSGKIFKINKEDNKLELIYEGYM